MRFRVLLPVVLGAVLCTCSPPPDLVLSATGENGSTDDPTTTVETPGAKGGTPHPGPSTPPSSTAGDSGTNPATNTAETLPATASSRPVRVEYEHLHGGVWSPRCPSCGEVQKDGATTCPGCSQVLVPYRKAWDCSVCTSTGNCDRCGDDRICSACDADGRCPYCEGTGKRQGQRCVECSGSGQCGECRGDGVRDTVGKDFPGGETALPGICPTCIDGSGYCPDCGTRGKDSAGKLCISCGGDGLCHDCGGTGLCSYDGGGGLCVVCDGHGVEVRNGPPPPPTEKVWSLRLNGGTTVVGTVVERPDPDLTLILSSGSERSRKTYPKFNMHPVSYLRVARFFIPTRPESEGKERSDLAVFAQSKRLWPLAMRELVRAKQVDPENSSNYASLLRTVETRRVDDWLDRAEAALKAGDRELGLKLLEMIRFEAAGEGKSTQARSKQLRARKQIEEEEEQLGDEARKKVAAQIEERLSRAVERAALHRERSRKLLEQARRENAEGLVFERLTSRAERAAWSAQRIVLESAHRHPPARHEWAETPASLVRAARALRAEAAVARAAYQVGVGRFRFAARLARFAARMDPGHPTARNVLVSAESGLLRQGLLDGSPPPVERNR